MSTNSPTIADIQTITALTGGGTTVIGLFSPYAGLLTTPASVGVATGNVLVDLSNGQPANVSLNQDGTVSVSSSIITFTARVEQMLMLGGLVVGVPVQAPIAIGLGILALALSPGLIDKLADPAFWSDVGKYLGLPSESAPDPAAVRPPTPQWVYNPFVDPLDMGVSDFNPNSLASIQDEYAEGELSIRFLPPTDPLVLDLDGNGIQTVGTSAGILFDHNGIGVKQLTGWAGPSDGFLVMDRNGNGKVDSLDANWASLRVWQDSNQDGISQAGELFSMTALGITDLKVASAAYFDFFFSSTNNLITSTGSYTRNGVTRQMGDVSGRVAAQQRGTHRPTPCGWNLVLDSTTRVFADSITETANDAVFEMRRVG